MRRPTKPRWVRPIPPARSYLAFMGPAEVLLPYVVKNELGGSARDLDSCSQPEVLGRSAPRSSWDSVATLVVTSL